MSGIVRFISDLHFGHRNMAIRRGFKDEYSHDEKIIENWNSVVNKRDTTYVLGDVTMERSNYEILDRLNGYKKVILGNHDKPQHVKKLLNYVNSVSGCINYKGGVILTHVPVNEREFNFTRSVVNLHGHIHEHILKDKRYVNVCCEQVDYTPRELEWLLNKNNLDLDKLIHIAIGLKKKENESSNSA